MLHGFERVLDSPAGSFGVRSSYLRRFHSYDFHYMRVPHSQIYFARRFSSFRHFPTLSVLRRHPAPSRQQFDGLVAVGEALGLTIDVETSKKLADSLDVATRQEEPYFNKLFRILSTRYVGISTRHSKSLVDVNSVNMAFVPDCFQHLYPPSRSQSNASRY